MSKCYILIRTFADRWFLCIQLLKNVSQIHWHAELEQRLPVQTTQRHTLVFLSGDWRG